MGLHIMRLLTPLRTALMRFLATSVLLRCVELCTRRQGNKNIPLCFQNGKGQNFTCVTVIWKQKALLEVIALL